MSAPRTSSGKSFTLEIPRNSLKIAGIAFLVGLLLFVAVWLGNRDKGFYQADPADPAPQQQVELAPLPEPLPAAAGSSDMPDARPTPAPAEAPKLVETQPAPPPAQTTPAEPGTPVAAPVASDRPTPVAGQSPPPRYPAAALRRGESGTVVLRVDVDASGSLTNIKVIERSGSRTLDRAARDAVARWRFNPAHSNGQPVPGSVEVPFDFKPVE